jgi:hypothetical protein
LITPSDAANSDDASDLDCFRNSPSGGGKSSLIPGVNDSERTILHTGLTRPNPVRATHGMINDLTRKCSASTERNNGQAQLTGVHAQDRLTGPILRAEKAAGQYEPLGMSFSKELSASTWTSHSMNRTLKNFSCPSGAVGIVQRGPCFRLISTESSEQQILNGQGPGHFAQSIRIPFPL